MEADRHRKHKITGAWHVWNSLMFHGLTFDMFFFIVWLWFMSDSSFPIHKKRKQTSQVLRHEGIRLPKSNHSILQMWSYRSWYDARWSTDLKNHLRKNHPRKLRWTLKLSTGWWFEIFFFIFTPIPGGDDPFWRAYFSKGLVQPPTSKTLHNWNENPLEKTFWGPAPRPWFWEKTSERNQKDTWDNFSVILRWANVFFQGGLVISQISKMTRENQKENVTIGIMKQSWKDVLCRIFTGRLFWGPEVSWTV